MILIETCLNIDNGQKDTNGNGCDDYLPGDCGNHDDRDFKSGDMCCACEGGFQGIII